MIILQFLFATILVLTVVLFIRNEMTYRYMKGLIALAFEDIERWRYRATVLDGINYNKIVLTFWKPITKVYPDAEERIRNA